MKKRKTTKQFVEQANAIHGGYYDYSLTEYTLSKNKIIVICPKHGKFRVIAANHLMGNVCHKCDRERKQEIAKGWFPE